MQAYKCNRCSAYYEVAFANALAIHEIDYAKVSPPVLLHLCDVCLASWREWLKEKTSAITKPIEMVAPVPKPSTKPNKESIEASRSVRTLA